MVLEELIDATLCRIPLKDLSFGVIGLTGDDLDCMPLIDQTSDQVINNEGLGPEILAH
jgi:hypothetical protein